MLIRVFLKVLLKQVLLAKGLWIKMIPKDCKAKFAFGLNPDYCALHSLGAQPDFKAQKLFFAKLLPKHTTLSVIFFPNSTANWLPLKTTKDMPRDTQ